jgi:hypothetical protein
VSKVATSAVCGMFERREGAASFNNNNPAPLSPHPRLLRAARCVLSIMRAAQQHTAATRVILRFPICCSIILTPPNVNFFVAIFCHICKSHIQISYMLQCHFDPTKFALFCGNLSIFCHRCKSHIQISYMLQCHFDPTKSALFCGNLSIFGHRCKNLFIFSICCSALSF